MSTSRQINSACRVIRQVAQTPRSAAALLLVSLSQRTRVADFELVDTTGENSADGAARLSAALELIRNTLPTVYARMRSDVARLVLLNGGTPEFWPFGKSIVLRKATVEGAELPLLAMTLVHEATHARLWSAGIGYPAKARARIERLCVGAEVRLARELPDGAELEAFALEKLSRAWWTSSAIAGMRKRARQELSEPP